MEPVDGLVDDKEKDDTEGEDENGEGDSSSVGSGLERELRDLEFEAGT